LHEPQPQHQPQASEEKQMNIGPEKAKPLSHEKQLELVVQAQAGNERARTRLIESNIGLVYKLVTDFHPHLRNQNTSSTEFEEYIQEGLITVEKSENRVNTRI